MGAAASYPDLEGKVVVVTGGTKGIGFSTAKLLAENGARVVVNGRDPDGTAEAAEELATLGGEVLGHAADVSSDTGLNSLRDAAMDSFGPAEGLLAFAGGFGSRTPLIDIEQDEWERVVFENLTATFLALKLFLPDMEAAGKGSIVTMASNGGRFLDIPLSASYAAAKAGVVMLTRHAAMESGPSGVRINCVAPATVLSPRVERLMNEELRAEISELSPLGRIGLPDDVANAAVYLLSDAASWQTGVTLDVAGGRVML